MVHCLQERFRFCPCTKSGLQGTLLEAGSASQTGRKPLYFFSRINFVLIQHEKSASLGIRWVPELIQVKGQDCTDITREESKTTSPNASDLVGSTEMWNLSQGIGFLGVRLFIFILAAVFAMFTAWLLTTSVSLELTVFLSCCAVGATQRPVPCVWCH